MLTRVYIIIIGIIQHHCRRCGDVICNSCSEKQPLSRMGFVDPVLVCTRCVPACKTEDDFFKHYLKILINGMS